MSRGSVNQLVGNRQKTPRRNIRRRATPTRAHRNHRKIPADRYSLPTGAGVVRPCASVHWGLVQAHSPCTLRKKRCARSRIGAGRAAERHVSKPSTASARSPGANVGKSVVPSCDGGCGTSALFIHTLRAKLRPLRSYRSFA